METIGQNTNFQQTHDLLEQVQIATIGSNLENNTNI